MAAIGWEADVASAIKLIKNRKMKRTIITLAISVLLTGCDRGEPPNAASTHYATDRCGGINRGWHSAEDYSRAAELFLHDVLFLSKNGLITWNGVARNPSELDTIFKSLPALREPYLEFVIEYGTDCQQTRDLREKLDPVCRLRSRCFELSEADKQLLTPPPLSPPLEN
jgi:hypothetical protein